MDKWVRATYLPAIPLSADGRRVTASEEHIRLSLEAAKEGMVLLKNEGKLLPLQKGAKIALFGKGTFDYVKGGGGSGDVTVPYIRNLYDGLCLLNSGASEGVTDIFEGTVSFYREYVRQQYAQGSVPGMLAEPKLPERLVREAAAFCDTAVISISRFSGEGWDRHCQNEAGTGSAEEDEMERISGRLFERGDFYLSDAEAEMVETVAGAFPHVIVVMNVGGVVDTEWFCHDERIQAVLLAWQGGIEGGLAAAQLLMGDGNPSGKLADTLAKRLEDYPSTPNFHDSLNYVDYTEDIYVGYRYFETIPGMAEKVNYPFGFGLSYTEFSLENIRAGKNGETIRITADVINTGSRDGKEVVQVYYSAPQGKLGKAARSLIAYQKTRLLSPGETQRVTLEFPIAGMASYDDLGKVKKSAYVLEKGEYAFYVGTSVRCTQKAEYVYEVKEDTVTLQLTEKMAPTSLKKRLLSDGTYEELPQKEPNDPNEDVLDRQGDHRSGYEPDAPAVEGKPMWGYEPGHPVLLDVAEGKLSLDEFVPLLSDEELMNLVGGQPNTGVANTCGLGNLPEYGVPNIMTADGPAGLRIRPGRMVTTTAFPCATLLACSWNPQIVEQVGAAGGREVKENNIGVWLTPAVNIHRSPLCGRNFEYYSEDPLLAGKQAAAMVRGIQSNHVAATVKHFALNDKETNRRDSDSRASERAIREIYLKQFEIIVKEADPWTIMSSYNIINGHRASENRELLEDILRGEWHFKGMVMTDWWTKGEHYKEVKAGNDLKMACGYPQRLAMAMEKGALTREELEICAKRILQLILKMD